MHHTIIMMHCIIVHHTIIMMHCTFIQFDKIAVQIVVIGLKSDQNCVKGLMAETGAGCSYPSG